MAIQIFTYDPIPWERVRVIISAMIGIGVTHGLYYFKRPVAAAHMFVVVISLVILLAIVTNGGIRAPAIYFIIVPLGLAIWLYSGKILALFFVSIIIITGAVTYFDSIGAMPHPPQLPVGLVWLAFIFAQLMLLAIMYLPRNLLYQSLDENRGKNEEIRAAGQQYRELVEETDDIIVRIDGDGRILFVNHASNKIYGLPPEECVGLLAIDFDHPDDRPATDALFNRFREEHISNARFENRQVSKSGQISYIAWQVKFEFDSDGKLIQTDGIGRDITERVQAEKIQEVIYDLARVTVTVPDVEQLVDLVRHHLGKLIDTTNFYIAIYDVETGGYFFPRYFDEFDQPDLNFEYLPNSYTDLVRQTGKSLIAGANLNTKSESEQFTQYGIDSKCWLGAPLITKNGVIGVLAIQSYSDPNAYTKSDLKVVESVVGSIATAIEIKRGEEVQKKMRDRLNQAERMESLGMLAGTVAHDLNNVLVPIVTYPDLILSQLPAETTVRSDVIEIKKAAKRASDIIEDLLTLTRRGDHKMEPLNLNFIVNEYLSSSGFKAVMVEAVDVELHTDLLADLSNISGSAQHLSKMVMNLINNSIQSYGSAGELWIRTRIESVSSRRLLFKDIPGGEYVVLEIADQGLGIPGDLLTKIFDPFYTTKRDAAAKGTGLGLSIVTGVIHDHNGYLDVETELGSGTTFTVYFPVSEESIPDQIKIGDIPTGVESILVIDDMENQIQIVKSILTTLGYSVTGTVGGRMGVEYLKREKVDLVLLDMIMEDDFDGLQTFEAILKIHPGQKAIIVSGYSESDKVEETLALGALAYLSKPYTVQEMGRAVRKALDS